MPSSPPSLVCPCSTTRRCATWLSPRRVDMASNRFQVPRPNFKPQHHHWVACRLCLFVLLVADALDFRGRCPVILSCIYIQYRTPIICTTQQEYSIHGGKGEVMELVAQLEVANPTTAPDLLDGNWIVL